MRRRGSIKPLLCMESRALVAPAPLAKVAARSGAAVPAIHVLRMGPQIRPRLEESVVEVQVQMVSLDIVEAEQGRHRARKLAEGVEDVLGLKADAGLELGREPLRGSPDRGALAPRTRRLLVVGAARSELALGQRLHGRRHVLVVRWAKSLEHAVEPGGVRG